MSQDKFLLSFWWRGDSKFGTSLVDLLRQKGVNISGENGIDRLRHYSVRKLGNKYRLESSGKDSPYGQFLKSDRREINIDNWQEFKSELKGYEIPKRFKMSSKQRSEIEELFAQGLVASEIAKQTGVPYASVYFITKRLKDVKNEEHVKKVNSEEKMKFCEKVCCLLLLKDIDGETAVKKAKKIASLMYD